MIKPLGWRGRIVLVQSVHRPDHFSSSTSRRPIDSVSPTTTLYVQDGHEGKTNAGQPRDNFHGVMAPIRSFTIHHGVVCTHAGQLSVNCFIPAPADVQITNTPSIRQPWTTHMTISLLYFNHPVLPNGRSAIWHMNVKILNAQTNMQAPIEIQHISISNNNIIINLCWKHTGDRVGRISTRKANYVLTKINDRSNH